MVGVVHNCHIAAHEPAAGRPVGKEWGLLMQKAVQCILFYQRGSIATIFLCWSANRCLPAACCGLLFEFQHALRGYRFDGFWVKAFTD